MERGEVTPAAVVVAARSGSLAAEAVCGALGQQGPLRNPSVAPHTLQLAIRAPWPQSPSQTRSSSMTHDPFDKCPLCSSQL